MIVISTSVTRCCPASLFSLFFSELLWMEVFLAVAPGLMLEVAPVRLPRFPQVVGQPQVLRAGLQEKLVLSLGPGEVRIVLAELVVVGLKDIVTIL